jgi:outer membrane protein assembly factor BamB
MEIRPAEIVAEHAFEGVERIHGVTFDGEAVWFAHGKEGEVLAAEPETGRVRARLRVPANAGAAFDGRHLWVVGGDRIRKVDPATGAALGEVPGFDATPVSGLAWADGALYAGVFTEKKILKIDPETGRVLRTLATDRLVTGVTWVDGELWHGTVAEPGGRAELRRVDEETGEVRDRLEMPEDAAVSGVEGDRRGRFWCGDWQSGKLRAVKKPRRSA